MGSGIASGAGGGRLTIESPASIGTRLAVVLPVNEP
jgi:hypothetical protein